MGSRRYSRQTNGRFRRATLENTFGLSVEVCPACRRMSPYRAGGEPPENCHACGSVLRPVGECSHCEARITLLGDCWTTDDGTTACTDTSAPYVPHKPKDALPPPPHVRESVTPGDQLDDPVLSALPNLAGLLVASCSCGGTYVTRAGDDEYRALEEAHERHVADALGSAPKEA